MGILSHPPARFFERRSRRGNTQSLCVAALSVSLCVLACGARRPPDLPEPSYRKAPLPEWTPDADVAEAAQVGGAGGATADQLPPEGAILGSDIWEVEGQWVTEDPKEDTDNSENSSTGSNESDTVADPERD